MIPTVSVIIPVHNQLAHLMKCLKSLIEKTEMSRAQLILVDDASTEFNLAEIPLPTPNILRNSSNMGFAATCNRGAQMAEGEYLFFLNSDTEAKTAWLAPMVGAFREHPEIGIAGPKLVFPDGSIQSCGGLFDGGRGPYHRHMGYLGTDRRVNRLEKVSWITGAALIIPRALFNEVGGFDEGYIRGYFEDVDLCMKVKALNKEVWYIPQAEFVHHVGQSTAAIPRTKDEERYAAHTFRRNSYRFHHRWNEKIVPDSEQLYVNY